MDAFICLTHFPTLHLPTDSYAHLPHATKSSFPHLSQHNLPVVLHVSFGRLQKEVNLLLTEGQREGGELLHLCFDLLCICRNSERPLISKLTVTLNTTPRFRGHSLRWWAELTQRSSCLLKTCSGIWQMVPATFCQFINTNFQCLWSGFHVTDQHTVIHTCEGNYTGYFKMFWNNYLKGQYCLFPSHIVKFYSTIK